MKPYDSVLGFIMAGGRGSRLRILTKYCCKSAVNILGSYRIFDFVAINIVNTGIPVTLVATQFESRSLSEYVGKGEIWGFDANGKKLELINPCEKDLRFEGTADCMRKSIDCVDRYMPDMVIVLAADHIYSMDYKDVIKHHNMKDADITIMTNVVSDSKVSDLGIVKIDESCRIIDFAEKPTDRKLIESFRLTDKMKERMGIKNPDLNFLASMGNYVFFWDRLKRFLDFPGVDFGKHIIPALRQDSRNLYAYVFNGYWRDVGRISDYFQCNMEFANGGFPVEFSRNLVEVPRDCQVSQKASIQNSILSPGDVISEGDIIKNSVLGNKVVIEKECLVDHCVFLGADEDELDEEHPMKRYTTHLGRGSRLSHVIVDKNVWIGEYIDINPGNCSREERENILKAIGLKAYRETDGANAEGDFYIDPETNILVIGKQSNPDPKEPILPDGLRC